MAVRKATAIWEGDLQNGRGRIRSESGALEGEHGFGTRFVDEKTFDGTNPEELIAAAHASCFSMALAHGLAGAGHTPESVRVEGAVHLGKEEGGFRITGVVLTCEAKVPGIAEEAFQKQVEQARTGCPVSKALRAIDIEVDARLVS